MPLPTAPAVVDRGPGEPVAAVVAGVHGDEPSGVRAVNEVLEDDPDLQASVRFVLANPPGYIANERGLDADLNRVFPGDADAEAREGRLAAQLCDLTADLPTLSLHATHSQPEPMAVADFDDDVAQVAASLPVPYVVDESPAVDGTFAECSQVVTVEAGHQQTERAARTAIEQIEAFLTHVGAYDGSVPESDSRLYRLEGVVEKPADAEYELHADNFERVEAGATYATADDETLVADEPFVPVLMSECGYDEIFGYRATEVGETLQTALASASSE